MEVRGIFLVLFPLLAFADDNLNNGSSSDAVNSFSVDFLQKVLQEKTGNVIVSPLSVSTLLAILHQGALGNTKDQLTHNLHAEPEQTHIIYSNIIKSLREVSNKTLLEFANGIFLNQEYQVLPKFKQQLEEDFLSDITTVNFAENIKSAEQINNWVSEHTHNRIKELVTSDMLSDLTRMVLTNAIYFKGLWQTAFKTEITTSKTFYADTEKQVPMMQMQNSFKTGFFDDLQAQWLEMPFQGERFSMMFVLPKEKNGLDDTLARITVKHISNIINNLNETNSEEVILSIPKFKLATKVKLIPILKKLGVNDLVSYDADLSGVSKEPVYVNEAVQKAEIEVDELGATASAATGFILPVPQSYIPIRRVVFQANHPFLVFIIDNNNRMVLFAGRVSDPSLS